MAVQSLPPDPDPVVTAIHAWPEPGWGVKGPTTMRIKARHEPNVLKDLTREVDTVERGVTKAVRRVGRNAKNGLRRQARRAGLEGVEKAWQLDTFPRRQASLNAAAFVFSKSDRILRAFTEGGTVRAQDADWLVIPLPPAERRGFDTNFARAGNAGQPRGDANVRAAERQLGRLRFVRTDMDTALLIHGGGGGTRGEALFLLKRRVTIPRKLDPDTVIRKWDAKLPRTITREIAKEDNRKARRDARRRRR